MKILVASDSHGNTQALINAVFDVSPQLVLHLGDHERDCGKLRGVFSESDGARRARERGYPVHGARL
jgi:predicted phosphodiesterase